MTMNPKERLLGAVADLQRFVIHHPDQARCPVCPRWDELQGAAMQAVTAIDDHEAELAALRIENDTLRAELESAHAAQRHAEKELSQYMAWYAMAEHQHLHEQRRAEKAEAERDKNKGCCVELREIAESIQDPRLHNTMTIAECVKELQAQLAAERARAESLHQRLVALEDEKNTYMDYVGDALGQDHDRETLWDAAQRVLSDRDRLRAAGRALLACPHIAERDTDPDWVDAETEAAVAEMRDALGEAK